MRIIFISKTQIQVIVQRSQDSVKRPYQPLSLIMTDRWQERHGVSSIHATFKWVIIFQHVVDLIFGVDGLGGTTIEEGAQLIQLHEYATAGICVANVWRTTGDAHPLCVINLDWSSIRILVRKSIQIFDRHAYTLIGGIIEHLDP